jgi:hypothetical protein
MAQADDTKSDLTRDDLAFELYVGSCAGFCDRNELQRVFLRDRSPESNAMYYRQADYLLSQFDVVAVLGKTTVKAPSPYDEIPPRPVTPSISLAPITCGTSYARGRADALLESLEMTLRTYFLYRNPRPENDE